MCKHLKVLYSLKQSLCLWYKRLTNFLLKKLSFKQINVDYSLLVTKTSLNRYVVSTFVDAIKIMALKDSGMIEQVKLKLTFTFFIIDIGPISFYSGLKMQQD